MRSSAAQLIQITWQRSNNSFSPPNIENGLTCKKAFPQNRAILWDAIGSIVYLIYSLAPISLRAVPRTTFCALSPRNLSTIFQNSNKRTIDRYRRQTWDSRRKNEFLRWYNRDYIKLCSESHWRLLTIWTDLSQTVVETGVSNLHTTSFKSS